MHFTHSELKEIYEGLIHWFSKKDSEIDSLEGTPSASDTVVIMHNNINKKTTVGNLVGHSVPLAAVATTGNYNDLNNKPTIPAAQVNADWNANDGKAQILNKPTIPAAQVNSDWNELDDTSKAFIFNKPAILPSYIPYDNNINEDYIKSYSKISEESDSTSIFHYVIVEPPTVFPTNYDLTAFLSYYIKTLKDKESSIVKLEFVSYNDTNNSTFINIEDYENFPEVTINLYGKFYKNGKDYLITSSSGTKTRCCIEIINFREDDKDVFYVTCECLGSYVNSINNE